MANKFVGVSIGDRFTDMIAVHSDDRGVDSQIRYAKIPNDPEDSLEGVLKALRQNGVTLDNVTAFIHATRVVEQALVARELTSLGLITTEGFRDILEIGTGERAKRFGFTEPPEALVRRDRRMEVPERVDATGTVLLPLDEDAVAGAVEHLRRRGAEAVLIHFMNAWANPMHEWRAYEIVQDVWPGVPTVTAHTFLNGAGEFERGAGAAASLGLAKGMEDWVGRLKQAFADKPFDGDILIMRGNGGAVAADRAAHHALDTVGAAPASAAMAAAYTALAADNPNIISCEIGATTCNITLVEGGHPVQTAHRRFDSRLPLPHLAVDWQSFPFGGEAVICIDSLGGLAVGPEMAAPDKGPVCFGRGGDVPTLLDAEVLLGRINPARVSGSEKAADIDAIRSAFAQKVGSKAGLSPEEIASAAVTIATDQIARAVRLFAVRHGLNSATMPVVLHGGGGPLYGPQLSRLLGGPKVMIPARPGLTAALGCLLADLRHDFRRSIDQYMHRMDFEILHEMLVEQIERGEQAIAQDGASYEGVSSFHMVDLRVAGQDALFSFRFEEPELDEEDLRSRFLEAWEKRYGDQPDPATIMIVDVHTTTIARRRGLGLSVLTGARRQSNSLNDALIAHRRVWFRNGWQEKTPVYRRESLRPSTGFLGPCVIEQMDTTIIVDPLDHVKLDEMGNMSIAIRTQS